MAGLAISAAFSTFAGRPPQVDNPWFSFDFGLYYGGAKIVLSPERAHFYDAAVQHDVISGIRSSFPATPQSLVMQYAPFVPCLLAPLALLPFDQALAIFYLASLVVYFAGFALLLKIRGSSHKRLLFGFFVALSALGTVPGFVTFHSGQVSCFVFFFACAYFYCLFRGRDRWAGVALALSSFKPHYAVFWAIPALAQRRWTIILTALILEALLLLLSVCVLGFPCVVGYPAAIVRGDQSEFLTEIARQMVSMRGLLLAVGANSLVKPLSIATLLFCLPFLYFIWRRFTRSFSDGNRLAVAGETRTTTEISPLSLINRFSWLCSSTVMFCLCASAHVHIYDSLLLAIPAVLTIYPVAGQTLAEQRAFAGSTLAMRLEKTIVYLIMATPYLQWFGLFLLPMEYRKSVPTGLSTLILSFLLIWRFNMLFAASDDKVWIMLKGLVKRKAL